MIELIEDPNASLPDAVGPVPMVWTTKGHIPAHELELRPHWDFDSAPGGWLRSAKVTIEYFHLGEFVRNDAYIYTADGVAAEGLAGRVGGGFFSTLWSKLCRKSP